MFNVSFSKLKIYFKNAVIPPNAVPFQVRPVTSWKGRVEISWPALATPIITETPQPL